MQNDAIERDDLPIDPDSNIAREGCTYEKYRVGAPPLQLRPLNSIAAAEDDPSCLCLMQMRSQIEAMLREIEVELDRMQDHEGNPATIQFVHRTVGRDLPSPQNLTVLVPAVWNENTPLNWLSAVEKIRSILLQDPITQVVKVEIMGRQLYQQRRIAVVEADHPIVAVWEEILPQVQTLIGPASEIDGLWASIGVERMGYEIDGEDGLRTTVSVVVDWDVNPVLWRKAESR